MFKTRLAPRKRPWGGDENSLDPMLGDGDLASEHPNSLFTDLVDAILPGLGVSAFNEPV
jgi:hypothetical protein